MEFSINLWAVVASGIASFALGYIWYGPLFGKQYMRMQGVTQEEASRMMQDPKVMRRMMRNYAGTFILALITAFVLGHLITFVDMYFAISGIGAGLVTAALVWLGFVAPATTNLIWFDKKKWDWWFLVNGYYLLQVLIMSVILSLWV